MSATVGPAADNAAMGPCPSARLTLEIEPKQFWYVWTKKGHVPRFAHDSNAAAEAEAIRLAAMHPGRKFIVLEARNAFSVRPAEVSA